jgi:hypothetical protein
MKRRDLLAGSAALASCMLITRAARSNQTPAIVQIEGHTFQLDDNKPAFRLTVNWHPDRRPRFLPRHTMTSAYEFHTIEVPGLYTAGVIAAGDQDRALRLGFGLAMCELRFRFRDELHDIERYEAMTRYRDIVIAQGGVAACVPSRVAGHYLLATRRLDLCP